MRHSRLPAPTHCTAQPVSILNTAGQFANDALLPNASLPRPQVPPFADDSLNEESSEEGPGGGTGSAAGAPPDALRLELEARQGTVDGYILAAARLVAPLLGEGGTGYDWCREALNGAGYAALAGEVQLARASAALAARQTAGAVALLREFERSDSKQRAQAAVNLSTLHLLEGQLGAAAGYADYCCEADPGSAAPLVSRGNVHLAQGQAEEALQVGRRGVAAVELWLCLPNLIGGAPTCRVGNRMLLGRGAGSRASHELLPAPAPPPTPNIV